MKAPLKVLGMGAASLGGILAARAWLRRRRRTNFANKVVLITGGSRGLGLLLAHEFAGRGARVAVCARNAEELQHASDQLAAVGSQMHTFVCDLSQRSQIQNLIQEVREQLGPVEILVNNAGILQAGPMETMTPEDYESAMAVNFWAPLYTTLEVLPDMRERGEGRIVNIASIGGKTSAPHLVPYNSSKHALVGLSQGMRVELAPHNIFVTTVCPNLMRIGSMYHSLMKGQHRKEFAIAQILSSNPLISTRPERVARWTVEACATGEPLVVPSLRGSAMVAFFNTFPNLSLELLSILERFLPSAEGPESIGSEGRTGIESTSAWAPSLLTIPNDLNARKLNELNEELAQAILARTPQGASHTHN